MPVLLELGTVHLRWCHLLLFAGSLSDPTYSPPYIGDWTVVIHPEGNPYYTKHAGYTIITGSPVTDPAVRAAADNWTRFLQQYAIDRSVAMPPQAETELYIDIDDDLESCRYYFIDHSDRTVFWLDQQDSDDLGLPMTSSENHLGRSILVVSPDLPSGILSYDSGHALEENYWAHVEYHPMHLKAMPLGALDELIFIFIHVLGGKPTDSLRLLNPT